ncbi:hypothetical protein CDL12_02903 [Handroanthus impetiginosus]|uniref:ENTH domain-containing protein n=1 Tax=Handroanthus impetiginosus TaxID=429701 RepID=A0A2G9I433_9LAMI|nr:hypothetical protein CDL12_02903 [Handroanthus impetiginosus]
MSILGSISNSGSMNGPIFHEFKKQASFFLKEKIKTARLALTDVTPAQLLAEEATNGNPGGPDARTLKMISRAAFEVDDYWRIVDILHKRLVRFDRRNWRASYKALIVLDYLLTHGPERVAEEFQSDADVIREMESLQHVDEKGFNWGVNVSKKCGRILKLLERGPLLKEERDKARKITRGIEGFGSFCIKTSSSPKTFDRCNSEFNDHTDHQDFFALSNENVMINTKTEKPLIPLSPESSKENLVPHEEVLMRETNVSKPLLGERRDKDRINMLRGDDHPFDDAENGTSVSLLSTADEL